MRTASKNIGRAFASERALPLGLRRDESLPKAPSGIQGVDEITGGGLPRGRPTLVCGGAGCGKTLFALEFLVRGATEHGEPGVFMSFEESEPEIAQVGEVVIMDPITNLVSNGTTLDARQMLTRLIDFLKTRGITALFTSLTGRGADLEQTDVGISSLIDTWLRPVARRAS